MRKRDELTNPKSCLSKARDDEMTFVLLERDAAASATIRFWIAERIRLGKNLPTDAQIIEAANCADWMAQQTHDMDEGGGFSEPPRCRRCNVVCHEGMPICTQIH